MSTSNYQIVYHNEIKYPYYALHHVTYNEVDGKEVVEIGEIVQIKGTAFENNIAAKLELAIHDAKKYPVLNGKEHGLN